MKLVAARYLVPLVALGAGMGFWFWRWNLPRPERYSVRRGDTLTTIARHHGVTVQQLRDWNGISGDLILVGQELLVWPPGEAASRPAGGSAVVRRRAGGTTGPALVSVSSALRSRSPLEMPPEHPCLDPPSPEALGDTGSQPGFVSSKGLSDEVIRSRMDDFLPELWRCVPPEHMPVGMVTLQLTVACTGRVSGVEVTESDGLDGDVISCVADTLRYVGFPAHDMPDGFVFWYPVRFSAH